LIILWSKQDIPFEWSENDKNICFKPLLKQNLQILWLMNKRLIPSGIPISTTLLVFDCSMPSESMFNLLVWMPQLRCLRNTHFSLQDLTSKACIEMCNTSVPKLEYLQLGHDLPNYDFHWPRNVQLSSIAIWTRNDHLYWDQAGELDKQLELLYDIRPNLRVLEVSLHQSNNLVFDTIRIAISHQDISRWKNLQSLTIINDNLEFDPSSFFASLFPLRNTHISQTLREFNIQEHRYPQYDWNKAIFESLPVIFPRLIQFKWTARMTIEMTKHVLTVEMVINWLQQWKELQLLCINNVDGEKSWWNEWIAEHFFQLERDLYNVQTSINPNHGG
jgi:hypothetical protein